MSYKVDTSNLPWFPLLQIIIIIVFFFTPIQAVEGLLEGYTPGAMEPELALRYRDCHVLVLKSLQDQRAYGPQWTNKQVTRVVFEFRGEQKYNLDAIEQMLRGHLLNLQAVDMQVAQVSWMIQPLLDEHLK